MTNRFDLKCECGDKSHIAVVEFDCSGGWYDSLTVGLGMNHYLPWYKRLVIGFKYVFGMDNTFQQYVEVVCDKESVQQLSEWIETVKPQMQ
jgi:hypothetical protein